MGLKSLGELKAFQFLYELFLIIFCAPMHLIESKDFTVYLIQQSIDLWTMQRERTAG